jgi:voltage-gated potassium channel
MADPVQPTGDMAKPVMSAVEKRKHRRLLAAALLRALLTATVLVVLYYIVPVAEEWRLSVGLRLVLGLAVFLVVLTWQIRMVVRASHPGIRAIEALAVAVPLFLLLFAGTYFLMSTNGSGNFSQENLSRTDSLYFAVTTFATVGYGDITATSQSARAVVTAQMILDLLILGLGINAIVSVVRWSRERSSAPEKSGAESG